MKATMNWFLAIGVVLLFGTLIAMNVNAAGETVYDKDGYSYTVPDNRKLVVVPWWWQTSYITYDWYGASDVVYSDKPAVFGDADGICPPEPEEELCISPCQGSVKIDPDCS